MVGRGLGIYISSSEPRFDITLVTLGKIPNDNMKYIKGFTDSFQISEKKDYRVEITIREVEDDGES